MTQVGQSETLTRCTTQQRQLKGSLVLQFLNGIDPIVRIPYELREEKGECRQIHLNEKLSKVPKLFGNKNLHTSDLPRLRVLSKMPGCLFLLAIAPH